MGFFRSTFSFINEISKPNPKYTTEKTDQEIMHIRNKVLLLSQFLLIVIFAIDALRGKTTLDIIVARYFAILTICTALILSCRYHPAVLTVFLSFFCAIYGPSIMNIGEEGIHRAIAVVMNLPLFLYLSTGSMWGFLCQAYLQLIYANSLYKATLHTHLIYATPESFVKSLTYSTSLSTIFNMALTMLIHFSMQQAYKRIAISEKRKEEVENQKIFLMGFSHELRNLINSLTGNVRLASFENLTQKAQELLLNAGVCGELLLHLVNNILDTGKVEIGELEINPAPTRTYETLERLWGICSELIRRKNLKGQMFIPKDLPKMLIIDHYRLTQIFLNLIGNAVKFTESGTVDITIEWINHAETVKEEVFEPYPFDCRDELDEGLFEKQRVFSAFDENVFALNLDVHSVDKNSLKRPACASGGVLKVSVNDTGCGMSNQETSKLFQKFTQVTTDASKRKLGTGLGLFITKQLCQKMNGDVKAFSKEGVGSSFIFCIPLKIGQEENGQLRDLEAMKSHFQKLKLKAMIVDDASFNHAILKCFFDKLGIEVIDIAENGLEAYNKYIQHIGRKDRPQIITMDLDMPIMDGKEAAKKIRELEIDMNLDPCFMPIISGNCSESEISECLSKEGRILADVFMNKPAAIEDLMRVIGSHFIQH